MQYIYAPVKCKGCEKLYQRQAQKVTVYHSKIMSECHTRSNVELDRPNTPPPPQTVILF